MSQIKLFRLLKSLIPQEQRGILAGLQAKGRKGQNPELLVRFFQTSLQEMKKGYDPENVLELKHRIWNKLFPGEDYKDNRFRKLAFRLNQYIQRFLVNRKLEEKEQEPFRQELLYETLWKRKQTKALDSLGKRLEGDELEMSRLRQFIAMRDVLDKEEGAKGKVNGETGFSELSRLFEIEQCFNSIKMACLELSCGKEVAYERLQELKIHGEKYKEASDLFQLNWHLFQTMTDLLNMFDLSEIALSREPNFRQQRALKFVHIFNKATAVSFREKYLVYRMFTNFLRSRIELEELGARDFLEAFLELDSRFADISGEFYGYMEPDKFLKLFDLGVGQLDQSSAMDLLECYLPLVEEPLRKKLGMTIQSLYLFAEGSFQEILDLAEMEGAEREPGGDKEKRLDIRLGLIQMQSKIELSPRSSVGSLSRWIKRCIKKCPSLNNTTKAALKNIVEYSEMLTKKFPVPVMEDHLKKVQKLEDILGLEIHKDWLEERFMKKAGNPVLV